MRPGKVCSRLGLPIQRSPSPVLRHYRCCTPSAPRGSPSPLNPQLSNTDFRSALTFRGVSSSKFSNAEPAFKVDSAWRSSDAHRLWKPFIIGPDVGFKTLQHKPAFMFDDGSWCHGPCPD